MTALFGGSGSEGIKYYCIVQVVLEIQGIRTCLLFVPLIILLLLLLLLLSLQLLSEPSEYHQSHDFTHKTKRLTAGSVNRSNLMSLCKFVVVNRVPSNNVVLVG